MRNECVREFRALSTPKSRDDGDRIGSYRKRQVKIKERESVPRKSHCLAPRFALPGGVLKILYSIVPARLRFEGGGGATHARVDRRTSEFHTACISHLPAESFSAFARQKSQGEALLPEENFSPLCRVNVSKTRKSKQLVFKRERTNPLPETYAHISHQGRAEKKLLIIYNKNWHRRAEEKLLYVIKIGLGLFTKKELSKKNDRWEFIIVKDRTSKSLGKFAFVILHLYPEVCTAG